MNKQKKTIRQPEQKTPRMPKQRRPVHRAALFHRKGCRNS